ncbi:hypothetical protein EDD37DRAFT_169109 [Exophiala viscosa]|uniref:DUF7702 domain-containing protein n=1 Tax=Exophiala viscosa TaxID=2486360 RepID=A0AAN6I9A0_9EURO|nr:hypothetical protein EDD36DRAFT_103925 [Exophiala viscosa]KAI1620214.1 hypothetical protein EDD37DRAFT_169109 [Exophiala viscosa]
MKLNARGGVSILELGVFLPSLAIATIICSRHGFGRSSGWVFTLILCLVRIIGACCQLATYHDQSQGLLEATIILDSIGISPLLLATLGLLSRCVDSINSTSKPMLGAVHFRVIQLFITVGLILSIAGGTSSVSSTGVYKTQTTSEVGIVLYIIAYMALLFVAFVSLSNVSNIACGERWLFWAVVTAMPLILVRLVYSLLLVFHHSHTFNVLSGSVTVLVVMAVVEEILVTFIYLFVGWKTEAAPKSYARPIESRPWKRSAAQPAASAAGTERQGRHGIRQGPIHQLVGLAVAAARGDEEHGGR